MRAYALSMATDFRTYWADQARALAPEPTWTDAWLTPAEARAARAADAELRMRGIR